MLTFILIAFAVIAVIVEIRILILGDELEEFKEELNQSELELDERANKLAAEEETCRMLNMQLRDELDRRTKAKVIGARYAVSESDMLKYKDENAMMKAIRRQLATGLANEIIHEFPEPNTTEGDDRGKIYYYKFRIE